MSSSQNPETDPPDGGMRRVSRRAHSYTLTGRQEQAVHHLPHREQATHSLRYFCIAVLRDFKDRINAIVKSHDLPDGKAVLDMFFEDHRNSFDVREFVDHDGNFKEDWSADFDAFLTNKGNKRRAEIVLPSESEVDDESEDDVKEDQGFLGPIGINLSRGRKTSRTRAVASNFARGTLKRGSGHSATTKVTVGDPASASTFVTRKPRAKNPPNFSGGSLERGAGVSKTKNVTVASRPSKRRLTESVEQPKKKRRSNARAKHATQSGIKYLDGEPTELDVKMGGPFAHKGNYQFQLKMLELAFPYFLAGKQDYVFRVCVCLAAPVSSFNTNFPSLLLHSLSP